MKNIFFIATLILSAPLVFGQYNPTTSMQDDFKYMSKLTGGRQTGFEGLQSYSSGEVKGSQFFYPTWADGSVTTVNNEVIGKNYQFVFDRVRHEVFIISKTDKKNPPEVLLADKSQLKSFSIITDKEHVFVPGRKYGADNANDFYEVLEKNDSAYTLLKYVKTRFVKFNSGDIEKVKNGDFYDEFIDDVSYYIVYKSGKPQKILLKEKNIVSIFPDSKKSVIEDYFNDHSQRELNDDFLIQVMEAVNK